MSMFKRRRREVPGLNTASLPDLIFTVLFFFMIVTHMRSVPLKVKYEVPAGTELTKLVKKSTVTYIYIGKSMAGGKGECVQLNDKVAAVDEVEGYVNSERSRMDAADASQMTVSIKADKHTSMGLITDVKQSLRRAKALRINYSAVEKQQ